MNNEKQIGLLERRLNRANIAKEEAERLLEIRSRELFLANESLKNTNDGLESAIQERIQDLKEARDVAINANKAKSQFLSSMSHELRTPLNAIIGFSQVLLYDELSSEQKDNIGEILNAGKHLLTLIDEVLDLSEVESGHMKVNLVPVEIKELIDDCISLSQPLAGRFNVKIVVKRIQDVPVLADYTRLKQVILNLLSNATKYNRKGGTVTIHTSFIPAQNIRITVEDTGKGLSFEQKNRIFEPFDRMDHQNSAIEGSGIGLVITKKIIEMMDGKIDFTSKERQGSKFWVDIPLAEDIKPKKNNICNQQLTSMETAPQIEEKNIHSPKKILIMEDNLANLKLVEKIIAKQKNLKLITAINPVIGMILANSQKPDLILLDINLPVMDGYEVLEKLRKNDITKNTPVVAITADAMKENLEKGSSNGFSEYITKPIEIDSLLQSINKHIS